MALNVSREDVWVAGIEDQAGALAAKLRTLAEAGAKLGFVIARRAPEKPGTGVVFLTPLKGVAQLRAARRAGFHKSKHLHSVRVEGLDAPGMGAKMAEALAAKGINLRGLSAAVIGRRFVANIAVDSGADAGKVIRILRSLS
jgi:predicted amino acid-binding ACT domain protein